jgi:sec-independent protein translocase protein TatA
MIPGLPSMGGLELIIILGIILLFFGAKRIPDLARSLGKGTREFRKGISEGAALEEDEAQNREEKDLKEKQPLEQPLEQSVEQSLEKEKGAAPRDERPRDERPRDERPRDERPSAAEDNGTIRAQHKP